jgi:hypothetical protein
MTPVGSRQWAVSLWYSEIEGDLAITETMAPATRSEMICASLAMLQYSVCPVAARIVD